MRAVVCDAFGPPETLVLRDLPPPSLPADGLRVRVRAAGVNFADGLFITGRYQRQPTLPVVPGFEIAGEVMEVGAAVQGFAPGDRVMAALDHGGWAEEVILPAAAALPLAPGLDLVAAGGVPVAYGTAHFGLVDRARLAPGDWVLVHGAGGGAGLTAVACAKALGAQVIATARGADKLEAARTHGADHVLTADPAPLKEAVRDLTGGRGVDVVYDPVGGALFDASLRCCAPDGRLLVVGFASGTVPAPPANQLLVRNLSVIGYDWGGMRALAPERIRASLMEVLRWWEAGRLTPPLGLTLPLAQAPQALTALADRSVTGKIVLIP